MQIKSTDDALVVNLGTPLFEAENRTRKVRKLIAALYEWAQMYELDPADALSRFDNHSWNLLSVLALTTVPSDQTKREVAEWVEFIDLHASKKGEAKNEPCNSRRRHCRH